MSKNELHFDWVYFLSFLGITFLVFISVGFDIVTLTYILIAFDIIVGLVLGFSGTSRYSSGKIVAACVIAILSMSALVDLNSGKGGFRDLIITILPGMLGLKVVISGSFDDIFNS